MYKLPYINKSLVDDFGDVNRIPTGKARHFALKGLQEAVVLVNDASRYSIVLYGLKAKDVGRLADLISQAIRETLLSEGVNPEII